MTDEVRAQYANSGNLLRRANLHATYSKVPWFTWLADHMDLARNAHVLDVGCGPGFIWQKAVDRLPTDLHLTLLDSSPAMVELATSALRSLHYASVQGEIADAMALPFPDECFDAVVMMHMLYHVPDVDRVLAEADRVLKPGGKVCITTNTPRNLQELTALSAQVFGTRPFDPAADLFSLNDASTALTKHYGHAVRQNQHETYACDDPEVVLSFLMSMPPANKGTAAEKAELSKAVGDAFAASPDGILITEKFTGLVSASK